MAFRLYTDSWPSGSNPPYSTQTLGSVVNYYYDLATWNNCMAFGLGFDNTVPYLDRADSSGFFPNKGFFGWYTGENTSSGSGGNEYDRIQLSRNAVTLGSISSWVKIGNGGTGATTRAPFAIKQVVTGSSSEANTSDTSFGARNTSANGGGIQANNLATGTPLTFLTAMPTNPTDGAKFTVGWEFLADIGDWPVRFTAFFDTTSHSEDNIMDVFDSYELATSPLAINLSTTSHNTDDAWRNSDQTVNFPSWLIFANGWLSNSLVVDAAAVSFATQEEI